MILTFALQMGQSGAWTLAERPSLDTPRWLAGCWEMSVGDLLVEEYWMAYRGGSLLGMSRSVRGGELRGYELLLLRQEGMGWVYEAHPSGQPSASFRSVAISDTSAVFSNPDHDFPQTITYVRTSPDSLIARTAGVRDGRTDEFEFPYRRVSCPG
jgi:hypothetical protein